MSVALAAAVLVLAWSSTASAYGDFVALWVRAYANGTWHAFTFDKQNGLWRLHKDMSTWPSQFPVEIVWKPTYDSNAAVVIAFACLDECAKQTEAKGVTDLAEAALGARWRSTFLMSRADYNGYVVHAYLAVSQAGPRSGEAAIQLQHRLKLKLN